MKIDRQGVIYVNRDRLTPEELVQRFRDTAAADRTTLVVIEADEEAAHKYVVGVMDRAKSSGLSRLAIATRQKK